MPKAGYTLKELSKIAGCSRNTVYLHIHQRKLKPFRDVTGQMRVDPIDAAVWIERYKIGV